MKQSEVAYMKKWLVPVIMIASILLIIFSLISYGIYWAFFDIQRLDRQEVITISDSPDSFYTVTTYLNNGGATTDYAVLCAVKNNKTGKERNIYWNYHCSTADIEWLDDKTVSINGIELDVTKDLYDYRRN